MSKKRRKKRYRRPNLPPDALRAAASAKAKGSLSPLQGMHDFTPDYSHVIRDIKRISVLAGTFLVLLIVLSFFLR